MDQILSRTAIAPVPPPVMIGGAIPLIDVAGFLSGTPGAAEKAAAELAWAFENVGFYYLAGHGVPQSLIDAQYEQAARFHAQPIEEKLRVKVNEHTIGYMPIAREAPPNAAAQGKKPSQNEAFFLRRERGADDLPGFREQTLKYMSTMEALCQKLVRLYGLALDLPADFFDGCFKVPHMILRQSRYPMIDAADEKIASLVPHTDSGFMTLLPPNKVQGLSINLPNGQWLDAPYVEGAFVVNGGDILHRWTNERFLSTPHRVRNVSGTVRYAIPFFCDPDHDTIIECLPSCQSAGNPPKYPPIKFGDYALWFAAQRYQHMQNVKTPTAADVAPGARATEAWKS
jgi:isopenicillin N synthase-like dioxygenase